MKVRIRVINRNGAAHNLRNLYIADASVFPTSLGVNPQLSTMVCATHIARKMLHTYRHFGSRLKLFTGQQIGDWTLLSKLGSGVDGQVWSVEKQVNGSTEQRAMKFV